MVSLLYTGDSSLFKHLLYPDSVEYCIIWKGFYTFKNNAVVLFFFFQAVCLMLMGISQQYWRLHRVTWVKVVDVGRQPSFRGGQMYLCELLTGGCKYNNHLQRLDWVKPENLRHFHWWTCCLWSWQKTLLSSRRCLIWIPFPQPLPEATLTRNVILGR